MLREIRVARVVSVLSLAALLGLIASGCSLPINSLSDFSTSAEEQVLTVTLATAQENRLIKDIPRVTVEDQDADSITLRVIPSSGTPYTVRVASNVSEDGRHDVVAYIDGVEIVNLSGLHLNTVSHLLAEGITDLEFKPQGIPAVAVIGAGLVFTIQCVPSAYYAYQSSKDKGKATAACISAGAGAVAGVVAALGVKNPWIAAAVSSVVSAIVTEAINNFGPSIWSSLTSLYDAMKVYYNRICDAVSRALQQMSITNLQRFAPIITRVELGSTNVRVGSSTTIRVHFSDQDKDVTQGRIQMLLGPIALDKYIWKSYDYFNQPTGQILYIATCNLPGTARLRALVGDYGDNWSKPWDFDVRCVWR